MDELQAERELDALVAGKVMETRPCVSIEYDDNDEPRYYYGDGMWGDPVPRYSTDIAAAWEVVETLGGHPHYFHISIEGSPSSAGKWNITIIGKEWIYCTNDDESAPLAICRAALEAVGQCDS